MSYISCDSNVCKQYRNECSAYIYGKTKTCKILKISKNYIEKEIGGLGQKKKTFTQIITVYLLILCYSLL